MWVEDKRRPGDQWTQWTLGDTDSVMPPPCPQFNVLLNWFALGISCISAT